MDSPACDVTTVLDAETACIDITSEECPTICLTDRPAERTVLTESLIYPSYIWVDSPTSDVRNGSNFETACNSNQYLHHSESTKCAGAQVHWVPGNTPLPYTNREVTHTHTGRRERTKTQKRRRGRREQAERERPGYFFQTLVGQAQLPVFVQMSPVLREADAGERRRQAEESRRRRDEGRKENIMKARENRREITAQSRHRTGRRLEVIGML